MTYLTRKEIQSKYGICRQTFHNKLNEVKGKYPTSLMKLKSNKWLISEIICDEVFKRKRQHRTDQPLYKHSNYLKEIEWNIFGGYRPTRGSIKENKEIINRFFLELKKQYPTKIELLFNVIEQNPITGNNQFNPALGHQYHSHFIIKSNLTQEELKGLISKTYNENDLFYGFYIDEYKKELNGIDYIIHDKRGDKTDKTTYKEHYMILKDKNYDKRRRIKI